MIKPNSNPLMSMLREIIPGLVLLTVTAYLISLLFGFKLSVLLGFVLGLIYVVLSYYYLSETVYRAVNQSKEKAQRMIFICYLLRYLILFILCLTAVITKVINVFALLIPQLFPKPVLMFNNYKEGKAVKNDKSSADK